MKRMGRIHRRLVAVVWGLAAAVAVPARADVRYVKWNAAGANDGTSWTHAYTDLQSALAEAQSNPAIDAIWVAQGNYKPHASDRCRSFDLRSGVALYGGFPGLAGQEGNLAVRNPVRHLTLLSGDITGNDPTTGDRTDNSVHVLTAAAVNGAALDGFTISSGQADFTGCLGGGGVLDRSGGGLLATGALNLLIRNCVFTRNAADVFGGAVVNDAAQSIFENCTFLDNTSDWDGGALANLNAGTVVIRNCTFLGNLAVARSGGALASESSDTTLHNSILWANLSADGGQIFLLGGLLTATFSDIQGGRDNVRIGSSIPSIITWGEPAGLDMLDLDPQLTPDGHLRSVSPCINQGTNTGAPPSDRDAEMRPGGGTVDMGSDEFVDSDGDALPDWFELQYATPGPGGDPDFDGLSNLLEYELYGSDPKTRGPLYVSPLGNDAWDGTAACLQSGTIGPKKTIQSAIDAAQSGDTILVMAPGSSVTYSGAGNINLDFRHKAIVVRRHALPGPGPCTSSGGAIIDCGNSARAIDPESIEGIFAVLEGFTIQNAAASDVGGALDTTRSRLLIRNCTIQNSSAGTEAGALYAGVSSPAFFGLTIGAGNSSPAVVLSNSHVNLAGPLTLQSGTLVTRGARFEGSGEISLGAGTQIQLDSVSAGVSVLRTNVTGTGSIDVASRRVLMLQQSSRIDLSGQTSLVTCDPQAPGPPSGSGLLSIQEFATLLIQDQASIQNTILDVKTLRVEGSNSLVHNEIHLHGTTPQFLISQQAIVQCNDIYSIGDQYLDFDPDPANRNLNITGNRWYVQIPIASPGSAGTLLELRMSDLDCIGNCPSRPVHLSTSPAGGYDSPWTLERLELLPNAKLNLTNRQGMVFETSPGGVPEALYVRTLKMNPFAVLNVGLQRLYYQQLVDQNDQPMTDPDPITQPLSNGSRFANVPLLGFSLVNIDMETQSEYEVRVQSRVRDASDTQPCACDGECEDGSPADASQCIEGLVQRIDDVSFGGVMEMRTQKEGQDLATSATSVAAKGSFARAGHEQILVMFDYLFTDDGAADDAELVVSLSDTPDVGATPCGAAPCCDADRCEVARVRPPAPGRPGAVGATRFSTFRGSFSRGSLNFTRGTYVELELRGQGARILINNFDPHVECLTCLDLDQTSTVDNRDYLLLLAESGQALPVPNDPGYCLNRGPSDDSYVDMLDLIGWDAFVNSTLDACLAGTAALRTEPLKSDVPRQTLALSASTPGSLLITGKTNAAGQQYDFLYNASTTGACLGDPQAPAGGISTRTNGRLIKDHSGEIYQLRSMRDNDSETDDPVGLIRLRDGAAVVMPQQFTDVAGSTVYLGINELGGGASAGFPLIDAAFSPTDSSILYVVPVLVVPDDGSCPYRAAAKLQLLGGGDYTLAPPYLYGENPAPGSSVSGGCSMVFEPDLQHLRELEIDAAGRLYVLSAQGLNDNDWLLVYDAQTGAAEDPVPLSDTVRSPSAMLFDASGYALYLAASVHDLTNGQTPIFKFTTSGGISPDPAHPSYTVTFPTGTDRGFGFASIVTALAEDAGKLYVVGFTMARFDPETPYYDSAFDANTGVIFAQPGLAVVDLASGEVSLDEASIGCTSLGLPLSAVVVSQHPADFDRDGDVDNDDYLYFENCTTRSGVPAIAGCRTLPTPDFDNDGDVDLNDFGQLQRCLGESGQTPPADC